MLCTSLRWSQFHSQISLEPARNEGWMRNEAETTASILQWSTDKGASMSSRYRSISGSQNPDHVMNRVRPSEVQRCKSASMLARSSASVVSLVMRCAICANAKFSCCIARLAMCSSCFGVAKWRSITSTSDGIPCSVSCCCTNSAGIYTPRPTAEDSTVTGAVPFTHRSRLQRASHQGIRPAGAASAGMRTQALRNRCVPAACLQAQA